MAAWVLSLSNPFFLFTATSFTQSDPDNDWCTVSVSCKTITVTATENVGITTRTAEIKITTAAGTTLTVEAHQEAMPFKLEKTTVNLTWKGEFSEQNILCFSQDPLLIDDSGIASWLKYELKDDFLHFKADPNTAGYGRKSTLKLTRTNGEMETITINQAGQLVKFTDLIGTYTLTFIDGDDEPRSVQVTFAQLVANTSYRVGSFVVPGPTTTTSYDITFTFDAVNNRINMVAAQNLGAWSTYRAWTILINWAEGYITNTTATTINYWADMDENSYNPKYVFKPENTNWTYPADAMGVWAFSSTTPAGWLEFFENMVFTKDSPVAIP